MMKSVVTLAVLATLLVCGGCTPPAGSNTAPEPPSGKKQKQPASTPYGKALEATDRLKQQAQDYNDKLDALNDPFAK